MSDVPSPATPRLLTAEQLLGAVSDLGGRIYRKQLPPEVFILTNSQTLAFDLMKRGAWPFRSAASDPGTNGPNGAYRRNSKPDSWEWDLSIAGLPVAGEQTLWEAAAPYQRKT